MKRKQARHWPSASPTFAPDALRAFLSKKAREQLRALDKILRRNIGRRMEAMRDDLRGDVKKLDARKNRYRLRVGKHRVLFTLEGNMFAIYDVKDRKAAYE